MCTAIISVLIKLFVWWRFRCRCSRVLSSLLSSLLKYKKIPAGMKYMFAEVCSTGLYLGSQWTAPLWPQVGVQLFKQLVDQGSAKKNITNKYGLKKHKLGKSFISLVPQWFIIISWVLSVLVNDNLSDFLQYSDFSMPRIGIKSAPSSVQGSV